jgi:hypothetical protein
MQVINILQNVLYVHETGSVKRAKQIFHSCTVHLDAIKVFYLPTDAKQSCYKRMLKFALKQLLHVSVQSPSSGSVLFELAKVTVINL